MWTSVDPAWIVGAVAVYAWVWGSFLNQCIDRTPRRTQDAASPQGLSILKPARSTCFSCARTIPWHENIPVLSYLVLRGRCGACGATIGRRTLIVETLVPLSFTGLALLWSQYQRDGRWDGLWLLWILAFVSWAGVLLVIVVEGRRIGIAPAIICGGLCVWGLLNYFVL